MAKQKMVVTIVKNAQSRSTSYSTRDIERVLTKHNLAFRHPTPSATAVYEVQVNPNDLKGLEYDLNKLKVFYRKDGLISVKE